MVYGMLDREKASYNREKGLFLDMITEKEDLTSRFEKEPQGIPKRLTGRLTDYSSTFALMSRYSLNDEDEEKDGVDEDDQGGCGKGPCGGGGGCGKGPCGGGGGCGKDNSGDE